MPTRHIRATALAAIVLLVYSSNAFGTPTPSRTLPNTSGSGTLLDGMSVASPAEQEQVGACLKALGYSPEQVKMTLALLSPDDVHHLALNVRQLQAAGGSRTRIVVTVAIAVVVLAIVLVVTRRPNISLLSDY
jgi:hypothetical protein